jgi:hypothetical protein
VSGKREIDALLKQERPWLDPPTNLMARPIQLPPMVPIKGTPNAPNRKGDKS